MRNRQDAGHGKRKQRQARGWGSPLTLPATCYKAGNCEPSSVETRNKARVGSSNTRYYRRGDQTTTKNRKRNKMGKNLDSTFPWTMLVARLRGCRPSAIPGSGVVYQTHTPNNKKHINSTPKRARNTCPQWLTDEREEDNPSKGKGQYVAGHACSVAMFFMAAVSQKYNSARTRPCHERKAGRHRHAATPLRGVNEPLPPPTPNKSVQGRRSSKNSNSSSSSKQYSAP